MTRTAILRSACLLPLLCAASLQPLAAQETAAQQKHLLRNAYEPGKSTWFRQTMLMEQRIKAGDRTVDSTTTTEIVFRSDTTEVTDGKAKMHREFTRAKVKMTGAMDVDYDSDDPESRPGPFGALADMIGEWIEVSVDDRGHIDKVDTSPTFPDRAVMALGGDLEQFVQQALPKLPDEPIAVGETWTDESTMAMAGVGDIAITITSKLLSVEGRHATLHQDVDMKFGDLPGGMKATVENAGGDTVVDLATGLPIDSTMTTVMKMSGGGAMAMDMTMKMTIRIARIDPPAETKAAGEDKDEDKE